MKITTQSLLAILLGMATLTAAELKEQFEPQEKIHFVGEVGHSGRDLTVVKEGTDILANISPDGKLQKTRFIDTKEKFKDVRLKLEFMVPEGPNSGVYFMGRYEIQIFDSFGKKNPGTSDLGALYNRWDEERNPKGYEGVPPKLNAAKAPGESQTMEVTFRAPRFAVDGSKTRNAKFMKVLINGELVQENQEAKGPTRSSKFSNETAEPSAIAIQADHGPAAIRKVELEKLELSTDGEKPLQGAAAAPLDDQGHPMRNTVSYGQELFKSKGCVECHGITEGEIKTGPSLHGIFLEMAKQVEVMESAEAHKRTLLADAEYLVSSICKPAAELAIMANGEPFPAIMPPYDFQIISDAEVGAIYSYLRTLNPKAEAGTATVWTKLPNYKYGLENDPIAVLVKGFPRIQAR